MRVTIIRDDGVVGVDGVFRSVDLNALPSGVRAMQWDGVSGHVEHDDMTNTGIGDISVFQSYIDLWTAAGVPHPLTLDEAKTAKVASLTASYNAAIQQPVTYMGTAFQADIDSQTKVVQVLSAMTPAGATPAGFYWVDAANNHVAMTLAQVQGLAQAMINQGWAAFQTLQTRKASVNAATTISDVQSITF